MKIALWVVLVIVNLWVLFGCEGSPCFRVQKDTVVAVGGCDKFGECGVRTLSGYIIHSKLPVVGEVVEFKVEIECKK